MKRNLIMLFAVVFFILVFLTNTYSSEEITLGTMYPASSGAYSLLRLINMEPSPTPPPPVIEHDLSMTYNSGINFFTFTFTGSYGDGLLFTHDGTSNDFVLASNGNIGIGTNAPQSQLHINSSDSEAILTLERTDMTVSAGDDIGRIDFRGGINSTNIDTVAQIKAEADQNWGGTPGSSRLVFSTTDHTGTLVERMTIDKIGDVGIGTNSPNYNLNIVEETNDFVGIEIENTSTGSSSSEGIYFANEEGCASIRLFDDTNTTYPGDLVFTNSKNNDSIHFFSGDDVTFNLNGSVGIGTFSPSSSYKLDVHGMINCELCHEYSDERFKKKIETIDNPLNKVLALRGVEFEWRRDEFKDRNFSEGKQIGLIAQEVEKVIPELVSEDGEGYKSLAYANIVALLIEAVKEQQEMIKVLEGKIKKMEEECKK